ncbi:hypothetical protein RND81_14G013000 [Saponaria officinalis]|uniref:GAG-pre-integrase domain-containing protein n=1 Tax=Saponaria officinalis TaxID=3572 RepID=A0AAW1GGY0_SAPOF
MLIALSAKNKLCFVEGTSPKPNSTSPNAKNWQRCNDMVFSWILNAVSSEIADSILYSDTTKSAWSELIDRFDQSNGEQLYGVHKKLSEFSQDNDCVTTYFTKLKSIWDEIDGMGMNPNCSCTCTCGATEKQTKFREDQKVIQFLMGLNEDYSIMRGTILMQNPPPKLSIVYNNLIQEERQREIRHTVQFQSDSASLYVKTGRNSSFGTNSQGYNQNGQHQRGQNQTVRGKNSYSATVKKPGHSVERCYRLQNRNRRFASHRTVPLTPQITLHNVLFVPSFKFNLLSMAKLCRQLNSIILFTPDLCCLQGSSMKMPVVLGNNSRDLYIHQQSYVPAHSSTSLHNVFPSAVCNNSVLLWHHRLGHLPLYKLQQMKLCNESDSNVNKVITSCSTCVKARQHKLSFPVSQISSSFPFYMIHIDLWGPYIPNSNV